MLIYQLCPSLAGPIILRHAMTSSFNEPRSRMIVGQENFIYHGFMIATRALRSGRG